MDLPIGFKPIEDFENRTKFVLKLKKKPIWAQAIKFQLVRQTLQWSSGSRLQGLFN
jgi:hypothetical protein